MFASVQGDVFQKSISLFLFFICCSEKDKRFFKIKNEKMQNYILKLQVAGGKNGCNVAVSFSLSWRDFEVHFVFAFGHQMHLLSC